jgi:hypothetical protein
MSAVKMIYQRDNLVCFDNNTSARMPIDENLFEILRVAAGRYFGNVL